MRAGRLILFLVAMGVAFWLWKHSAQSVGTASESGSPAPVDRARTAAARQNAQSAETSAAQSAVDANAPAAAITENMTPDQVRALLGAPDDVKTETLDSGGTRETWTYRSAAKTVIFENGVAVAIR